MIAHNIDSINSRPDDPASLLEAYALYALPEADARAVEEYLATGGDADDRARLVQWEETAAMLPHLLEPVAPAPQLRTRLLAQVYADALEESGGTVAPVRGTLPPQGPSVAVSAPVSLSAWRERRTRLAAWASGAVAAALLLVTVGLGAWTAALQSDVAVRNRVIADQRRDLAAVGETRTLAATQSGAMAQGQLLRLANPQAAVLTISGLPPLAQGRVYQVWFIQGNTPTGAGLFSPNADGTWSGLVRGDVTSAQTIAISAEPAGGSSAPTGNIVATGML